MKTIRFFVFSVLVFCFNVKVLAQTNTFPSSGNVGIGTASPGAKLSIIGGSLSSDYGLHFSTGLTSGRIGSYDEGTVASQHTYYDNTSLEMSAGSSSGYVTGMSFTAKNATLYSGAVRFITASTERMRISDNGNVGVGTTSPGSRLSIYGGSLTSSADYSMHISTALTNGRIGTYDAGSLAAIHTYYDNASLEFSAGSSDGYVSAISVTGKNSGQYNGSIRLMTASAERMRIDNSGKVGIGTTSPSEKLSVNGNIVARKIRVQPDGWSDYVFDKGYKLRSLSSVETFIKQNNRLPDLPSAREVKEMGISVGENQALLLKKIEELTLYVIELKKSNNNLQQQINSLKKTNEK